MSLTPRGRRALALVGLVSLAASGALVARAWPPTTRPAAGSVAAPRTPLWSPRRIPVLVAEEASRLTLTDRLRRITAGTDACIALSAGGEPIVDMNAAHALMPASTLKLVTSVGVIDTLGGNSRFSTRIAGPVPVRGVVSGDLYLIGGGDPTLGTAAYARGLAQRPRYAGFPVTRIEALADRVVASGVRRVEGRLVADDSQLDTIRFLPEWSSSYLEEVGPLGALDVNGGFEPPGTAMRVADPALDAASVLVALLAERGVTVAGGPARGVAPPGEHEIARILSPTVREIVAALLGASDNFSAEVLTREAGRAAGAATTAGGTASVVAHVRRLGVPTAGLRIVDGSGLSRDDRASCATLLGALAIAHTRRFAAIRAGLPIAAERGTLVERFAGTSLAHRLRAKTGNIDGVVGLAGTIDIETDRDPWFAFIANGRFSPAAGESLQAAVATEIAAFPRLTPPDLVPTP